MNQQLLRETMQRMTYEYQSLMLDLTRSHNVNELFSEYAMLCVQLQSSRGVNARHFEMITDKNKVRNDQINGMMIGVKMAAYRNRIVELCQIAEEKVNRGRLLDIYSSIAIDENKSDIRDTIKNAIIQNKRYRDFDQETKRELKSLLGAFIGESEAVKRSNVFQHLV